MPVDFSRSISAFVMYTSRYWCQKASACSGPINSLKYSSISRGEVGPVLEEEHVALGLQPVAQVGAAQHQRVTVAIHQFASLRVHKSGLADWAWSEIQGAAVHRASTAKQQRTHHNSSGRIAGLVPAAAPF